MLEYYRRRATTYESIYAKPERQADLRAMEAALPADFAGRRVLEVACGTGWWTLRGARDAKRWLATDLNPQTMAIARQKVMPACVQSATVDAYTLAGLGSETFDATGNSYQQRTLDDGSSHEVLKNFPTREQAFAMLAAQALEPQWHDHDHYWVLRYTRR